MKATTLPTEFYKELYDKIDNYGFEPDTEDDCYCSMDFEDLHGFYVTLDATFEVKFIDDSFDHAFGTEYGYHFEAGNLEDIEAVTLTDEDGNDVSALFDYDTFFEQFKRYEVKFFRSGDVVKSGDTILAGGHYVNRWDEMQFLYYDSLAERYICIPVGAEDNKINRRSFPKIKSNQ